MAAKSVMVSQNTFRTIRRALNRLKHYGEGQSIPGQDYIHQDVFEAETALRALDRVVAEHEFVMKYTTAG